jgi:hypothetical protein
MKAFQMKLAKKFKISIVTSRCSISFQNALCSHRQFLLKFLDLFMYKNVINKLCRKKSKISISIFFIARKF